MTPELVALAHRAVACKGWRWMPGMMRLRVTPPEMRDYLRREGRVPDTGDDWSYGGWPVIPDLTDPATLGCLLALVREVWSDAEAHIALGGAGWVLLSGESRVATVVYPIKPGQTEAEALVHALEAANELQ